MIFRANQLRERGAALAAVSQCLDRGRAGKGNVLCLIGEAGLGKTALLDTAGELAGSDFAVARGRGERMELMIPFGVAEQLYTSLPGPGDGSLLAEPPAVEPSVPYVRFLRQLKAGADRDRPLLMLLDDLHWADRDTLSLFGFLSRRISDLPVSIIAALRPWPKQAHEIVLGLGRDGARVERLTQLSRESSLAMLRQAMEEASAAELEQAWRLSGGNPFLIGLTSQLWARDGGIVDADSEPVEVEQEAGIATGLLLSRFAGIDELSMRFARCAAVAGVRFRPDIAIAAADLAASDADLALEALFRSGLVVDDEAGLMRFTHPLFEQALYSQMAPPVRRRVHARIFELLVERGLEREAADHAIRGEMIGNRLAGEVLARTGTGALAAGAVDSAASKLTWAVRIHADRCPPELYLRSAQALIACGRAGEAAEAIEKLLDRERRLPWQDEVAALRALGQARYLTGSPDLGDRHTAAAVAITERHDPVAAVRPLLEQATIAWMSTGPIAALPLAARARDLADDDAPELRLAADVLWGHLAIESGDPKGFDEIEPVARRLADGDTEHLLSPAELVWPAAAIYGYAHSAKYAERLDESLSALELARDALVEAGAANGVATVTLFIGNQLVRRGRLKTALREADSAEEYSDLTPLTRPFASLIKAEAMAWMGRFDESLAQLEEAEASAPRTGLWAVSMWAGLVRGQCLLWQGDATASDQFLALERQARDVGLVEPSSQPWMAFAVEAHLAAGRRGDAGRVTAELERLSTGMASRWTASVATLSRGRLLEFDGEPGAAEAAYRAALERLGDVDLPLLRARILLVIGGLIRRSGRSVEARPPLAEAIQLAEEIGADYLAGRAASELRLAGGRRRRPARQRDALTPAERRVALEVAAGATNAEVARRLHISGNTVATHLKRIYSKLGIGSRKQLAELLVGRGAESGARNLPPQD